MQLAPSHRRLFVVPKSRCHFFQIQSMNVYRTVLSLIADTARLHDFVCWPTFRGLCARSSSSARPPGARGAEELYTLCDASVAEHFRETEQRVRNSESCAIGQRYQCLDDDEQRHCEADDLVAIAAL
jgi:hypothetical protein